jgi:hypothetical protein
VRVFGDAGRARSWRGIHSTDGRETSGANVLSLTLGDDDEEESRMSRQSVWLMDDPWVWFAVVRLVVG